VKRRFEVVRGGWAIVRLAADSPLPDWLPRSGDFASITRTRDELSIVCADGVAPAHALAERGWALLRIEGPLNPGEVGVLASFAAPLAAAGISVFTISTFDTDYLLVKAGRLEDACAALAAAGHQRTA
jgi:hypothetical protein